MKTALLLLLLVLACNSPSPQPQGFVGPGFVPGGGGSLTGLRGATTNIQSENLIATWLSNSGTLPTLTDIDDWRRSSHWLEDFSNTGVTQAYTTFSGAGAGATIAFLTITDGATIRPSVAALTTGTTATGRFGSQTSGLLYLFGTDAQTAYASLMLPVLSTAVEEYTIYTGFGDSMVGDQVDGAYFQYDRPVGGDKWRIAVASNSVRSKQTLDGTGGTIDSPVVAGAWVNTRIKCTSSRCDFFMAAPAGAWSNVGSACVAASGCTLNSVVLPTTAGRQTGVLTNTIKSVGVTGITTNLDLHGYYGPFLNPR